MLDNELVWTSFFHILDIQVAAALKRRQGRCGEPGANILDRASKGVFPCCRVTMAELIGKEEYKHIEHNFRKAFKE